MKGHWSVIPLASILIIGSLGISQQAFGFFPTFVTPFDIGNCDVLAVPPVVDELGLVAGGFPSGELITSFDFGSTILQRACPTATPSGPTLIVNITNTGIPDSTYFEVWYVADTGTTITNFDGIVNGEHAFRIDADYCDPGGANHPLNYESIANNCIFEPGETWGFFIDSYASPIGPPSLIDSIGVPSPGPFVPPSSGSIIALFDEGFLFGPVGGTSIPVDTTALLVAGAQTMTPWLILGVVSAIGIGIAVFTLKRNR